MEKELNVCGLVAMILSILGIFVAGIPCGIAGIVLGIVGLTKENKGKGMAIAGLIIGILDLSVITTCLVL